MGTRHLIIVRKDKQNKIAQYGQWDGYLEGQGKDILGFLNDKNNIKLLKESLSRVRFVDEVKDKAFLDEYNKNSPNWSNEPDNRTEEQKRWFKTYISRDLGFDILLNIIESNDKEILLKDSTSFSKDDLFCEYLYVIDLDKETFAIYKSGFDDLLKEYSFNKLPTEKELLNLDKEK